LRCPKIRAGAREFVRQERVSCGEFAEFLAAGEAGSKDDLVRAFFADPHLRYIAT
jgi:hypothetical protein